MGTIFESLHKAIKNHGGLTDEEIKEAGEHGADSGWSGFTYYEDTTKFYNKHHDLIWELVSEEADDQGVTPMALIASFAQADSITNDSTFKNLLAWFALEEVGRWLADKEEREEED